MTAEGMKGFSTIAVHGADRDDRDDVEALPHTAALHQTTAFTFARADDAVAAFQGSGGYTYTRKSNPTIRALERHISDLEAVPVHAAGGVRAAPGHPRSLFFTTGMAAISSTLLGLGREGRVVCQGGIYGTTEAFAGGLGRFGIAVDFARVGDLDDLESVVGSGPPPALVVVESPANPLVQVTDIEAAAGIAHDVGALLAVDSTFATPALQRPLAWGADLVLHSTTKFMAGHGVVLGGVVTGDDALLSESVEPMRTQLGGSADPFAAWLTSLGLKTLALRMERHSRNADRLAGWLADHPRVRRVHRPDPERLPRGQLLAGGPMLSFDLEGGAAAALATIDRLRLITLAPTLGNLDTLVQHPWSMSHVVLPESRRLEMGIGPGLLRLSTGIEAADDLIADLERALED